MRDLGHLKNVCEFIVATELRSKVLNTPRRQKSAHGVSSETRATLGLYEHSPAHKYIMILNALSLDSLIYENVIPTNASILSL